MSRMYTVTFVQQTVATASGDVDLFELNPADDVAIEIVGLLLSVTSELGDAQEEILPFQIIRGHTTSSNGTAATPRALDPRDPAATFTAETLGATIASAGTPVTLVADGFNVRAGYPMWFPDSCGPRATQADTSIVVRLSAAVADDVTMSGTLFVREV